MAMIVAMSRFRVKNDLERDVRQAFLDRPRFVDDQAGFLGLEVFQDPADSAVFFLVTRWSDVSSFRSWHASQAHKHSHEPMPKGLKLDAAFTELRVMERLEGEHDQESFKHFSADWGSLARAHLRSSATVHVVVATTDGVIVATNPAMDGLLNSEPGQLVGQSLWQFLSPESANELHSRVETGVRRPEERVPLAFVSAVSGKHLLRCSLDIQPNAFALLGEQIDLIEMNGQGGQNRPRGGPIE